MAKPTTKLTDAIKKELESYASGGTSALDLSEEAFDAMFNMAIGKEDKAKVEQVRKAKRAGAIASVPVNILKSVAAIAQTVTGIKGLKALKAPIPPAPPERDVQLLERMRTAKLEAEQPVTPAMQRAREAQAIEAAGRGRATARAATAGQLGLYAPLAQATNLGILKQMRAGVAEDEALRTQKQQIFDRLLQQRALETRGIQQAKQKEFYRFEYPEFRAQRGAYAGLARTGLTSMLNILGGIPEIAQRFAAARKPAPTGQQLQQPTPPTSIYGIGYTPPQGEVAPQEYNPYTSAPYNLLQYTEPDNEPFAPNLYRSEYLGLPQ